MSDTSTGAPALPPSRQAGEVQVGEELPELTIPLSRTFIISSAIASRDYQDVHHDHELAQQKGSADIFNNILTSNGIVGRFITDWAGPASRLRKVSVRLGVPNYAGDTMVLSGQVTAVDGPTIEVEVRGRNSLGDHVTGTVTVELPGGPR
jgi:3-oxo-4,17-pregnadiene-20-carboxyl-CoA hydratase beta subunit